MQLEWRRQEGDDGMGGERTPAVNVPGPTSQHMQIQMAVSFAVFRVP